MPPVQRNIGLIVSTALPIAHDTGADTFFKLAFAAGVLVLCLEVGYLVYSPLPFDPVGYLVGRDFVNTWLGAQVALTGDPGTHFGVDAYNALLAERFGGQYPLHIWSYPPHVTATFLVTPYARVAHA